MKKSPFSNIVPTSLLAGLVLAASCTVDTSGLTFDDDEFAKVSGDGDGDGTGGSGDGDGDASGGMGGGSTGGSGDGDGDATGGSGDGDGDATGGMGGSITMEPENMPGDLRCTGKQVEFFAGGTTWAPLGNPCEFLCEGGACTGACAPDSVECVSALEARTCDSAGTWESTPCEFACVGTDCSGVCVPGSRKCLGNQRQVCSDLGMWENEGDPCEGECAETAEGAACTGVCISGDTQCTGPQMIAVCSGGEWPLMGNACQFVCLHDPSGGYPDACGGVCEPFTSTCNAGNARVGCGSNGQPTPPIQCAGQACVNGSCVGECEPGNVRCDRDSTQICNGSGVWKEETNCAEKYGEGFTCQNVSEGTGGKVTPLCGNCNPSASADRCRTDRNGNNIDTCVVEDEVASWRLSKECGTNLCFAGACYTKINELCPDAPPLTKVCTDLNLYWQCPQNGLGTPKEYACDFNQECQFDGECTGGIILPPEL